MSRTVENVLTRRTILAMAVFVASRPVLAAESLAETAPIPEAIAPGTKLVIGDPSTRVALTLSGEIGKLPF